jgi:crotonobetainyl-CoA:carnitine CoA-transferase CaiB-like acyl-CoA transferase
MKNKAEGLLEGIRVLDLANEEAGFCSKLLADLGATVVKIEHPGRNLSRASRSFYYHNLNKLGINLNLQDPKGQHTFRELIQSADVLVESSAPGRMEALHLGKSQLRGINPRLIHLSITGFGRTGPRRKYNSCDCVQAAFGGQMHVTGSSCGKPLKLAGSQSHYAASLFGANAILLHLKQRAITGRGSYIDLSVQEAVASTLDHVMIDYFQRRIAPDHPPDDARIESFFTLPCKNGYVEIPLLRDWETILELVNSEEAPDKRLEVHWKDAAYRNKHARLLWDAVASWTRRHTKQELFRIGQVMRFPWAPVESVGEAVGSRQLKARTFFVSARGDRKRMAVSAPGLPYKFSAFVPPPPKPAPLPGEHTRQVLKEFATAAKKHSRQGGEHARISAASCGEILKGIRVLDFTRMLSGPYATRILGDFGAEVIKVQSRLTASGAESNETPYFGAWNRNKRSMTLNLNHPEAIRILLKLVSVCDIVVENYSPRVLANWGITYPRLKAIRPDLIMASVSAMGHTGPWKNYVGFADTFHALSGLMHETSRSLDSPVAVGFAYGDVIAGLYAALAILSSLEYRNRTGKGQYIDLSAYEALSTLLGPEYMAFSPSRKRRLPASEEPAHWGCYPCAGTGRWCVIAIRNEKEWNSFRDISDLRALRRATFVAWTRNGKGRAELDREIAQWTAGFTAESLVDRLQRKGIAAGIVQNAEDLARDPQLTARSFFTPLDHPRLGTRFSDRSALWPCDEKPTHWKAAPELGEANHYVFVDLLGYSESEFRAMVNKGILENE